MVPTAFCVAVLVGLVINALTGIGTMGLRAVWARVADAEPVVVHSTVQTDSCDAWVIPGGKPGSKRLPSEAYRSDEDYRTWIREHNAVQADLTMVELTIRGGSSDAVVLQDLRIRVLDRSQPFQGTVVDNNCGGPLPPRRYKANLDAADPVLQPDRDPFTEDEPPVTFPYRVTNADAEVIRVVANTRACYCKWVLELVYIDGEREHVKRINDGGIPFRTTAVPSRQPEGGE